MRIISNFKDFYDVGMSYGVDINRIFKRSTTSINLSRSQLPSKFLKNQPPLSADCNNVIFGTEYRIYDLFADSEFIHFELSNKTHVFSFKSAILLFCGELYPFFIVNKDAKKICDESGESLFVYSIESFNRLLSNNDLAFNESLHKFGINIGATKTIEQFFKPHFEKDVVLKILIDSKSPYLYAYRSADYHSCFEIVNLPLLKEIGFHKIADPVTSFQNIDMFVSGVLSQCDCDCAQVDDSSLKKAKGFDEYSFRRRSDHQTK